MFFIKQGQSTTAIIEDDGSIRTVLNSQRRLEALRRAGIVERAEEGVWRVPPNLVERGRAYDAKRLDGASVSLLSQFPIEHHVRAIGATWLDRQLIYGASPDTETGFSGDVRAALRQRLTFLADEGFADRGQQVVLKGNLLAGLRNRELEAEAKKLSIEVGFAYRPAHERRQVSGIYRRSITLTSGQFAILENGNEFCLVPWRPVMEKHIGREIRGVVAGSSVSWDFSRVRGPSL